MKLQVVHRTTSACCRQTLLRQGCQIVVITDGFYLPHTGILFSSYRNRWHVFWQAAARRPASLRHRRDHCRRWVFSVLQAWSCYQMWLLLGCSTSRGSHSLARRPRPPVSQTLTTSRAGARDVSWIYMDISPTSKTPAFITAEALKGYPSGVEVLHP